MPEFIPTHSSAEALADIEPPLDAFTVAYLEAAEWLLDDSDDNETGEPYDWANSEGWSPEAIEQARADCADFQTANAADLAKAYECDNYRGEVSAGHDFWLTRNHHGAGFWDRGLGDVGDKLTTAAHGFGDADAYLGDDNFIHLS